MIDQLSVCLPNRPGCLAGMCGLLGSWNTQIYGLMVADTSDFGIVRVICDRPKTTARRLGECGYTAITSRMVAVQVDDVPGSLGAVLDRLASYDLNVEYAYSSSIGNKVVDIVKVSGEPLEIKLAESGVRLLSPADLYVPDA